MDAALTPSSPLVARVRRLPAASALAAGAIAGVALLGWGIGAESLASWLPGRPTMKPNAAVLVLLASVSLWLLRSSEAGWLRRRVGRGLSLAVAAFALVIASQYVHGMDLGIDQLLFREAPRAVETSQPGRISPNALLCLACLSIALAAIDARPRSRRSPAGILALAAIAIAYFALLGYAFDSSAALGVPGTTKLSAPAALAYLILGVGVISSRLDRWPLRLLLADTSGGRTARWAVTALAVIPFSLEAIEALGQSTGLYGAQTAHRIFDIALMFVMMPFLWWGALMLHRAEEGRGRATRARLEGESRHRRVVENALDALVSADADGCITYVNPAGERLFGCSADDLLGSSVTVLVPERHRPPGAPDLRRLLKSGEQGTSRSSAAGATTARSSLWSCRSVPSRRTAAAASRQAVATSESAGAPRRRCVVRRSCIACFSRACPIPRHC